MARVYDRPVWRKVRTQVLARDRNLCQIGDSHCTREATQVDHIVPIHAGGEAYDLRNLRAACENCNKGRANPSSFRNHPTYKPLRSY